MDFNDKKIQDELSEHLKLLRFKAKLSQEDVANKLGISRNSYNMYENSPLKMTLEHLLQLSKILESNLFNFFYRSSCTKQHTINNQMIDELNNYKEN